jgi:hypothetical protein
VTSDKRERSRGWLADFAKELSQTYASQVIAHGPISAGGDFRHDAFHAAAYRAFAEDFPTANGYSRARLDRVVNFEK